MMRHGFHMALIASAFAAVAQGASAFTCTFANKCFESRGCSSAALTLDVDIDGKVIETVSGTLTIVAVKQTEELITMFATGLGAEYMLSLSKTRARFSSHSNAGPEVSSYLGTCEGAL